MGQLTLREWTDINADLWQMEQQAKGHKAADSWPPPAHMLDQG